MKRWLCLIFCIFCLFCFCFSASAEKHEVSLNASYTLLTPASKAYPDDGVKLTDGHYAAIPDNATKYFASPAYVGFNKNDVDEKGNFTVIIDLGAVYHGITDFTVGYLSQEDANIFAPKEISFAISKTRHGDYTEAGSITTDDKDKETQLHAKNLEIIPRSARYVLVTITPAEYNGKADGDTVAPWTFIDEISVRAIGDGDASADNQATDDQANGGTVTPPADNESIPQPGDTTLILAFVLLGASAITMAVALAVKKPKIKL